jgi:glucose/arabinose dehydrogenase
MKKGNRGTGGSGFGGIFWAVIFLGWTGAPMEAALLDSNFTETTYVNDSSNLSQMTGMAWAPDGSNRLFVTRKTGQIRIIQNGALVPTPFATVSVFTNSECGLIGIAFDPSFATNGHVYVFATVSSSEQRIIRFTASGNTGTNPTIIIPNLPTQGQNHDGGGVGIGPDGKLYWSIGDLGNGTGVDADLTSLAAKVGRANRDGTLPADNPFNDGAGPNNDFIWARGVRNPFTFTFQPGTGKHWINVVGTSYEQVFVVGRGDHAGYNDFENNQPAGYLTPVIKYRTNGTDSRTIAASGAVRNNNVATFTTTSTHRFRKGEKITISGVTDASFHGAFYVTSMPTATTFTVNQAGANATSGGGTAVTQNQGGCISGGAFWDSTAAPAGYRGNFFYGDYNSGRMMRAILDNANGIESVDYFSGNAHFSNYIDTAIGPDGAIYYASVGNGQVRRAAFNFTSQQLVVTPTYLQTDEGGSAAFSVRLATAPVSDVTVTVARASGDDNLSVTSGATLTFTPSNYATPQAVMIAAAEDTDAETDTAVFSVASAGLATETVQATALDNDQPAIVPSVTTLSLSEGGTAVLTVRLSGPPSADTTVTIAWASGDANLSVSAGGSLLFTAANYATPQEVTIAAAEDGDAADDTAVFSISGTGLATQTLDVTAEDNDAVAPAITTSPVTTGVVGASYTYDVNATGNPSPVFSLTVFPPGMGIDTGTGIITWTPGAAGTYEVTVQAANGMTPDAVQSYSIEVAADQPPTASLTRPYPDEIVSGVSAEWFGDGLDDVGCTQAQFFVDGNPVYTDTTPGNHYHFGGSHLLWDTTTLSNGGHTLRMTVTDTAGQTASTEVNVIVANGIAPFDAWRQAKFTPGEVSDPLISGPAADPEKDGLMNWMEYGLGLEPKSAGPLDRLPSSGIETDEGTPYLTLRYRRPVGGRPGVLYTVQVSEDLAAWSEGSGATTTVSVTPQGDGTETVIVRDNVPVAGDDRRFLRLQITPED